MKVKTKIALTGNEWETRVAIIEDDRLVEFYIERAESQALVGRIYKGRVENVVKGLRGAFVNVGLRKNGFLPLVEIPEFDELSDEEVGPDGAKPEPRTITLREGEEILVQIVKDAFAEKGARLTSFVSIPGRNLVYFPNAQRVGISRRIHDRRDRNRLREPRAASSRRTPGSSSAPPPRKPRTKTSRPSSGAGGDVGRSPPQGRNRTVAVPAVRRAADRGQARPRPPGSQRREDGVDSEERYQEITDYMGRVAPHLKRKVELYHGEVPLLEQTGVEAELERIFQKRIWLKSGGFITIDQTEAMVAIDVNTGRSAKEEDPERLILATNLEAAAEIARQIRLRDLAGLLVLDFIDMEDPKNTEKVIAELKLQLSNDRAKADYSKMSRFGLLEMTRERTRPGMMYSMQETCPTCKGSGRVRSRPEIAMKIERAIISKLPKLRGRKLRIVAPPALTDFLTTDWYDRLSEFAKRYELAIDVKIDYQLQPTDFKLLTEAV